jgi:hypothetical protein
MLNKGMQMQRMTFHEEKNKNPKAWEKVAPCELLASDHC